MADRFDTLGLRILEAARLAVAVHLNQGVELTSQRGHRVAIGRAGPQVAANYSLATDYSTDGTMPDRFAEGAAK